MIKLSHSKNYVTHDKTFECDRTDWQNVQKHCDYNPKHMEQNLNINILNPWTEVVL